MKKIKNNYRYFSRFELILWLSSIVLVTCAFLIFDRSNYLTLIASLLGATALIFCAKGNPFGQLLMVSFSLLYGYISYTYSYFGEMITYLCMSAPMALVALISWFKNPYGKSHAVVKINRIRKNEVWLMLSLCVIVTIAFYFILKAFGTANLIPSTISISTSFIAVYLTFRRSPFFALAYAINDVILIVLWVLATIDNVSYVSMIVCFIMFLANDLYSFINWLRMEKSQQE